MTIGRNKQEQAMFDSLDELDCCQVTLLKPRKLSGMAVWLNARFGITMPQARAVRDRWLKLRKQEKKEAKCQSKPK